MTKASKASVSKLPAPPPAPEEVLNFPKKWHRPFVGYLEEHQARWDKLDQAARQTFIKDKRTGLKKWASDNMLSNMLPEEHQLLSVRNIS